MPSQRILLRRREVLLAAGSTALYACGSPAPTGTLPIVPVDPQLAPWEQAMFLRVNRDRGERGHPPLAYDARLADVARYHADDMARNRFFAHESPTSGSIDDRLARAAILVATGRENLAEASSVETAEDGLLKSPGHFANLMATDITHIGIGIVRGGVLSPANMLFVQVFARPVETQSPEEARATVLATITAARAQRRLSKPIIDDLLNDIAESEVEDLDDDVSESSLGTIGKRAIAKSKGGPPGRAILCTGQRIVAASEYTPPNAALTMPSLRIGLAAAPGKDERGHPAIKILLLIAA